MYFGDCSSVTWTHGTRFPLFSGCAFAGNGSLCYIEVLYLDTVLPVNSYCVLNNFSPNEKVTAHASILKYLSPRVPVLVSQL